MLTLVLLNPQRQWSLSELAAHVGVAPSTAQREMVRAEEVGVVCSRRLGGMRLVRADPASPLTEPLTELLLRSFGPPQVIAEELAGVPGIDRAFVFGSWAERFQGNRGAPPDDVDVLIIGAPDRDLLDDAVVRATRRLALEVHPTVRSIDWWQRSQDGFRQQVAARPHLPLSIGRPSAVAPVTEGQNFAG